MPTVTGTIGFNIYSAAFKANLKHKFSDQANPARVEKKPVAPNAAFTDGVATKDLVINRETALSLRIFLPDYAVESGKVHGYSWMSRELGLRSNSDASSPSRGPNNSQYMGYMPKEGETHQRLPVMVQFHSGGFVLGRKDSVANDKFCRRVSKMCNAIVVAVGYRLAPENKCPIAYEDGYEVLQWLSRQADLVRNETSTGQIFKGSEKKHIEEMREMAKSFVTEEVVDPWLAAHADFSRLVLIGASSGANIANEVAFRAAIQQETLPILGQILLYPLFYGKVPTHSEVTMGQNSFFFDRPTLEVVWKLFLKEEDLSFDNPCVNPLVREEYPQNMAPTFIVTAELDMLRDRCVAYSEVLKKAGIDSHICSYKDVVHGFATLEITIDTPQAVACVEDISVWMHKHASSPSQ